MVESKKLTKTLEDPVDNLMQEDLNLNLIQNVGKEVCWG